MGVFIIMFLAPLIMQHVTFGNNYVDYEKKNKRSVFLFFTILTSLAALRHECIGKDTVRYIYFFEKFSLMEFDAISKVELEKGFSYLNKFVSIFTDNPQIFLCVIAIITNIMIFPTYRRLNTDSFLTIVLFCILPTFSAVFSGVRQMIAIGIGVLAYEFTRKKKLFLFLICVILAITFHSSAFMILFMYPLYHAKITKKWLFAVVPVLAMIFLFNKQIFSALGLLLERYTGYDTTISQTGAYTMLILFAIFAVFSFLIPDEEVLDDETIGLRNFLLLSFALQMFAPLHTIAMRMNYYYIIFIPLLLPRIIECSNERWKEVAVMSRYVMTVFFIVYFFINSVGDDLNVFPYHFFWEDV